MQSLLAELRRALPWLLAIALAAAGGSGIAVVIVDDDPATPDRTVTTIKLPAAAEEEAKVLDASDELAAAPFDADGDARPDDGVVVAPEPAVEAALERVEEGEPRKDPAGGAAAVQGAIRANKARTEPLPLGGAFQGFRGCKTRLLPEDSSSRAGVRPVWLQWHYAVIRNQPGLADLDLLYNIFADRGRQASSSFGIDAEGNCYYMVPIERKPWTAVATNPFVITVEVIAWGDEKQYCPGPCLRKARMVARQVKARTGIPLRRGTVNPQNRCAPGSAGQVTHNDHGICAGGHVDISPFSMDAFTRQLAASPVTLTANERKIVRSARQPRGTGHSRRYWCRRLTQARARIESGKKHRRPARRNILRRAARGTC